MEGFRKGSIVYHNTRTEFLYRCYRYVYCCVHLYGIRCLRFLLMNCLFMFREKSGKKFVVCTLNTCTSNGITVSAVTNAKTTKRTTKQIYYICKQYVNKNVFLFALFISIGPSRAHTMSRDMHGQTFSIFFSKSVGTGFRNFSLNNYSRL